MKVIEDTASRLVLRDRTIWISVVCAGATVVLLLVSVSQHNPSAIITATVFLAFALAFLHLSDVTFDKTARTCVVSRVDVLNRKYALLDFKDIVDVKVESYEYRRNYSVFYSYRLNLVTASDVLPLTASFQSGLGHYNDMRSTILDALADHAPPPIATVV